MNVTHTHMHPRARLVLASIVVLTTLLLIGARPSIASAASNVRLHPNGGDFSCTYSLTVTATSTNVSGDSLYIDDPNGLVGDNLVITPNASVLATPNWDPNGARGVYNNHPIGVWFDTTRGQWAILNEDGAAMPLGASFNVLFTDPLCLYTGAIVATSTNTVWNWMNLPTSFEANPPNWTLQDLFIVTPNFNPNTVDGVYNNHPIGVWFEGPKGPWGIFNEDFGSMPLGASFDVYSDGGGCCNGDCCAGPVYTVTSGVNGVINGDSTIINDPALNKKPSAKILVTPNFNPNGGGGVFNNHTVGVWYNAAIARWEIFNEDQSAMPAGAAFNYTVI